MCVYVCVCACACVCLGFEPMQLPSPLHEQQLMLANASCIVTPAAAGYA